MDSSRLNWKRRKFEDLAKQLWAIGFEWGTKFIRLNVVQFLRDEAEKEEGSKKFLLDLADRLEEVDWSDIIDEQQARIRNEVFAKVGIDLSRMSYELMR